MRSIVNNRDETLFMLVHGAMLHDGTTFSVVYRSSMVCRV